MRRRRQVLQDRGQAKCKQRLPRVAQKVHDAMLGVAEEDASAVGEQMQLAIARGQVGQRWP